MPIFKILLIAIEVICSLLLVVVILLQKAKGEGLGMAFGAEMGESLFGARASNVLVKTTIWLGVIFIVNTIILAMMYSNAPRWSFIRRSAPAPVQKVAPASLPAPAQPVAPAVPPSGSTMPRPAAPSTPASPSE